MSSIPTVSPSTDNHYQTSIVGERNPTREEIICVLNYLKKTCNSVSAARGWWHHAQDDGGMHLLSDPKYAPYVIATKIALEGSEVFEAFEGYRRGLMDDKLPHYDMLTVEQADTMIRMFDLCGELDLPVAEALLDKMEFNVIREDHYIVVRRASGGKRF